MSQKAQTSRQASLERRRAMSSRGKSALQSKDRIRTADSVLASPAAATAAPQVEPKVAAETKPSCGCQHQEATSASTAAPRARSGARTMKVAINPTRAASLARRKSQSTRGKSATGGSGTKAAVSARTGKADLSSRELAQALRDQRSQQGAAGMPKKSEVARPTRPPRVKTSGADDANWKVGVGETAYGQSVTGTMVGRSQKVTGDEPSTCRAITGTDYLGADIFRSFCQSDAPKSPRKVRVSPTRAGGTVTGNEVGRSSKVTGDEPGTCKNVTGSQYLGSNQIDAFCDTSAPARTAMAKGAQGMGGVMTGRSKTLQGQSVTGTQPGRSERVTGNEPGTCKSVTGTPYAGLEQVQGYCAEPAAKQIMARTTPRRATPGSVMTGIQPGIGGKMTGAERGACDPITGTPYLGADQFAQACPATPAQPNSPDYPQTIDGAGWGQFSVEPPSHASNDAGEHSAITGSRYEQGHITGPFGMAPGKVTGTEEARFDRKQAATPAPMVATLHEGRVKPRISGEGMDAGVRITGDDWDRGDRVTGTEGRTATGRNPTRRGPMNAVSMAQQNKRNEEVAEPISKVTGGSGNTDRGALITYSGGARG
ncbi:MAG: CsoS2 family carboxysome shell protein [Gammaproteobacteria bacterium]